MCPTNKVSAEDVRHLQNRVEEFRFVHVMRDIHDVQSCPVCMARWIVQYAEGQSAPAEPRVLLPTTGAM